MPSVDWRPFANECVKASYVIAPLEATVSLSGTTAPVNATATLPDGTPAPAQLEQLENLERVRTT